MINFRFLVNTKYLKIHKGISIMSWSVTCGLLLSKSVNLKNQGEVVPLTDSESFCSQISL